MAKVVEDRRRLIPVILCIVSSLIVVSSIINATADKAKVGLVNKLGVAVTVEVVRISHINAMLNYIAGFGTESRCILRLADNTYLAIPLKLIREVEMKGKEHLVSLNNELQFKGYLEGTIQTDNSTNSAKQYDLGSITKLSLISFPLEEPDEDKSELKKPYQLRITKPVSTTYRISNPRFVFRYWSGAGYLVGGEYHATSTSLFYIKVDEEDISANISDFKEITLFGNETDTEETTMVKVKSRTGIVTTGESLLKAIDNKGLHNAQSGWVFVADLQDTGGVQIVLRRPNCVMQETDPNGG